jgi:hypothetical protein
MLTTEEISRLWTAFQAKYRPTAAYQVSVILIESEISTKQSLPVQKRTLTVTPFQKPVITQILSQSSPASPALNQPIFMNSILVLQGSELQGGVTSVLFGSIPATPTSITSSQITVPVPPGLLAGAQTVQVVQSLLLGNPPVPHNSVESDPVGFLLQPNILGSVVLDSQGSGSDPRSGDLQIDLDIPVAPSQTVLVMLNQWIPSGSPPQEPLAYSFPVPPRESLDSPPAVLPAPTNQLVVPFSEVAAGTYLIRVQVDAAQSPLTTASGGAFDGPLVTIP